MLDFLHIENIAVIELADIDFYSGFNVLTGETGAGKSIIIDSINAVLGARTSKDVIRSGCDTACVIAQFSDVGPAAIKALKENDLSPDEDGKVIIQRNLSVDSKTSFRVCGRPVNAATVREIGKYLINIHGQHDNQSLLDVDKHCGFIDKLAENNKLLTDYSDEFKNFISLRRELNALETDDEAKARKIDLLSYQIDELEKANVKVGEFEKLKDDLKIAQDFEKIAKRLNESMMILKGDENPGVTEAVYNAIKLLNNEKCTAISDKLNTALELLNDSAAELEILIDNEFSVPLDTEKIEERLDLLRRLMLKYGNSEEKMLEFLENAKSELQKIQFSDKRAEELGELLEASQARLIETGQALTLSRETAAEKFSANVCDILKYLDMPNVKFKVNIEKGTYTKNGCDNVEFLISANVGEDLRPLAKIASGGELSRIMLAIKSVLTDKDDVETLIFDEVDTGISGQAATKVARRLKMIAERRQVICVTHLAQIAAFAEKQLLIKKESKNNKTFTTVVPLDYDARIHELARIMSGTDITENLYNSAKELLDNSK